MSSRVGLAPYSRCDQHEMKSLSILHASRLCFFTSYEGWSADQLSRLLPGVAMCSDRYGIFSPYIDLNTEDRSGLEQEFTQNRFPLTILICCCHHQNSDIWTAKWGAPAFHIPHFWPVKPDSTSRTGAHLLALRLEETTLRSLVCSVMTSRFASRDQIQLEEDSFYCLWCCLKHVFHVRDLPILWNSVSGLPLNFELRNVFLMTVAYTCSSFPHKTPSFTPLLDWQLYLFQGKFYDNIEPPLDAEQPRGNEFLTLATMLLPMIRRQPWNHVKRLSTLWVSFAWLDGELIDTLYFY
jgi:hypothetical protein